MKIDLVAFLRFRVGLLDNLDRLSGRNLVASDREPEKGAVISGRTLSRSVTVGGGGEVFWTRQGRQLLFREREMTSFLRGKKERSLPQDLGAAS